VLLTCCVARLSIFSVGDRWQKCEITKEMRGRGRGRTEIRMSERFIVQVSRGGIGTECGCDCIVTPSIVKFQPTLKGIPKAAKSGSKSK
jgi:hypothetical protein